MKGLKYLLVALCILLISGVGLAKRYNVEVGQFEKLKINGNISVVYKNLPDSTGMARYEAPEDSEDYFKFSTKGEGTLKVEPADEKWGEQDLPVLFVYSDFLSSLESFSDLTVEVIDIAPCASLNLNQVGNGTIYVDNVKSNNVSASITTGKGSIYLTGTCINANFKMVGTGLISADQLKANNVKCRILGTGSIGCWPIDNLNVTGLGTTKIYYKGKPNIKKTGGGKLFELPEDLDEEAYSRLGTPVATFNDTSVEEPEEEEEFEEVNEDDDDYQTIVTEDD